jgi:hypothetical protein
MKKIGLSESELQEIASTYWDSLEDTDPALKSFREVGLKLASLFNKLLALNNERIAEQVQQSQVDVLPAPDENTYVAVAHTGLKDDGMSVRLFGEAHNLRDFYLEDIEVVAALYDEQGNVMDRGATTIEGLPPNGRYPFEIEIRDAAPFASYEIVANYGEWRI